ncbi:YggS family pyridoxal phosphate-dependent enzyme [Oceanobacillus zhaokaii]|uniref:Pyridoxal phosphate homeostasis protein n=1 Tax=Oceanobacillus zhaokaii TaxID=2052660 RepID=A0A345PG77_9BACI|nr:YggS family pyridoxal phosphate-dependent enzyme [Oceanobacillus zhaokaii]AXI09007.1 YggS family pyridoxal phosphate-dependent enzyme [Oceanobacillus zhaokaii]
MDVAANLEMINHNINEACARSNRKSEELTIIGVTKYVTIERTIEAIEAGIENIGENRNEGFLEKYNQIGTRAKWHFIGSLQSRKVKDIIDKVDVLHSLDRLSLAKEINKRAGKRVDCFIQVNVSGEQSKHGLAPEEVLLFIENLAAYEKVHIIGLMTMAPHIDDEEKIRSVFRQLSVLRDSIQSLNYDHAPCSFLSMGMSNDYEIAIEEGATHIRIGSNLVGN